MSENSETSARHGEIALRAYGFWELEGQPSGRDVEHWMRAEAEIYAEAEAEANANRPADEI